MDNSQPRRVGNIDVITPTAIDGWYINTQLPGPATLRVYLDGILVREVPTCMLRDDVRDAGHGKAECGFHIDLPRTATPTTLVEIIDSADDIAVWHIDVPQGRAVNNLLLGELPPALPNRPKPETPVTMPNNDGPEPRLLFDVSDLVYYIGHHDNLTGIQRVQSSVIQAIGKYGLVPASNVGFIAYDAHLAKFQVIDGTSFRTLLADLSKPVDARTVAFDRHKARTGNLFSLGDLKPGRTVDKNTVVVLLGAAWVVPDYINIIVNLKRRYGVRFVPIFHDLIPIYARETCDQGTAEVFKDFLDQILRHVDLGLCVSENTARDLARYCAETGVPAAPTLVTRNGSSLEEFFATGEEVDDDRLGYLTDKPYVLFVSTIEGRKNHLYAFQIWEKLLKAGVNMPRLVCVGRLGWRSEAFLQALLRTNNLDGHVHIVEDISDAELQSLYKSSRFTIYPSQYEGWGLPVGESLYYGKPCVITGGSSLPEVAGEFGIHIPAHDVDGAAAVIRNLVENPPILAAAVDHVRTGYKPISWRDVAGRVVEGARRALTNPATNTTPVWQPGREYAFRSLRLDQAGLMGQQMMEALLRANRRLLLDGLLAPEDKLLALESRTDGWYCPEANLTWARGSSARLTFALDVTTIPVDAGLCLYAILQVPGEYLPCSVQLQFGQRRLPEKFRIQEGSRTYRWAIPADLLREQGRQLLDGLFEISVSFELLEINQAGKAALSSKDSRDLGVGLASIMLTSQTDYARRLEIVERQLFA